MYLLTNQAINLVGIFQLSDKRIALDTGLEVKEIVIAKEELTRGKKVFFCDGWIYVVNAFKNNRYWRNYKVHDAWHNEFTSISEKALEYFSSARGTDIYREQKSEVDFYS